MKQDNLKKPTAKRSLYKTGNAAPKKNYRGLCIALLSGVILLVGIMSAVSFLNIQLFRRSQEMSPEDYAFRLSSVKPEIAASEEPDTHAVAHVAPENALQLQLEHAPPAVDSVPQEGGLPLQDIYAQTITGVVSVSGHGGFGSGVIISECGYLLTDRHLLGEANTAEILFHDGATRSAQLVGFDPISGLAVLDTEAEGLTPVTFGDDAQVQVGDAVVTIGDPLGTTLRGTMTSGFVSAINRDLQVGGRYISLLQTSAPFSIGNSGGPLLNCYGQVIGINTSHIPDRLTAVNMENLSFAIPSSTVKDVVDQLLLHGYVSDIAMLDFTVEQVSAFDQLYYRVPAGLFITQVETGSPVQAGDILLKLAGCRVGDVETLRQCLNQYRAGDTVTAVIYRNGSQFETTLILKEAK